MDNSNLRIGDTLEWGEDGYPMICVFKTLMNDFEYVVLHPSDAPDEIQFVIMRLNSKGIMIPETNRGVCETILNLYSQFRERNNQSEETE